MRLPSKRIDLFKVMKSAEFSLLNFYKPFDPLDSFVFKFRSDDFDFINIKVELYTGGNHGGH